MLKMRWKTVASGGLVTLFTIVGFDVRGTFTDRGSGTPPSGTARVATTTHTNLRTEKSHTPTSPWVANQAKKDPSLVKFLHQLQRVTQERNAPALLRMVDPHVKCSFGVDHGKPTFISLWHLGNDAKSSKIWRELHDMMGFGGDFLGTDGTEFMMPYVAVHFPANVSDINDMVLGYGVRVHAAPSLKSRVVNSLSFAVVRPISPPTGQPAMVDGYPYRFIRIITPSGQKGYVCSKYLRNPYSLRMGIHKQHGTWKINIFVSGD